MNINVNRSSVRLTINDDPNRVIEFNPNDLGFVERFYTLISSFEEKEKEYQEKLLSLPDDSEVDSYGIPKNTSKKIILIKDVCEYVKEQIDTVFGQGTSIIVFGNLTTLEMFSEFFEGITPYIQKARQGKTDKYLIGKGSVM